MSSAAASAALAALNVARPAIARLDRSPDSDDLPVLLAEVWSGLEGALRALAGIGPESATDLLRETRRRQLLTFEQANALAAFHAAYKGTRDGLSRPSPADGNLARDAFNSLEAALRSPTTPPGLIRRDTPPKAVTPSLTPPGMRASPLSGPTIVPPPDDSRGWLKPWVMLLVLLLILVAVAARWYAGRRDRLVGNAIELYERGMHDAASAEFARAVDVDPAYALPHVYLARIAREANDLPRSQRELQVAVAAAPQNPLALREMGAYLLTAGNYELARKFYLRALDVNVEDHVAQGYLACALFKLGRTDEAMRWIGRAGEGSWRTCIPNQLRGAPPAL